MILVLSSRLGHWESYSIENSTGYIYIKLHAHKLASYSSDGTAQFSVSGRH